MLTILHSMISVIIPIYNRSKVLTRCLQSFENQSFRPLELVLVDNASSDDSYQICLDFQKKYHSEHLQIKVLQESKPGACAARNAGLKAASGDYISFFDSDDEVYPDMYAYLDTYIQSYPRAALIAFRAHLECQGKMRLHPKRKGVDLAQHLVDPLVVTHSFILRRDALDALPLWNESLARWQDFEYGSRLLYLLSSQEIVWIDKALYRIHAGEDSISGFSYSKDADALAASLQAIEDFLQANQPDGKEWRAALAYKKIHLASLLFHEAQLSEKELAQWEDYAHQARQQAAKKYRPLLALHEAYSKRGGRGFWRIFSLFLS